MSNQEFYNFQTVLAAVPGRIDELVQHLYPEARKQSGSYRIGGADGERGKSFSISTKPSNAGHFIDHADPGLKGNAIGLWALAKGVGYQEAGNQLAQFLGVQPEERLHSPKKRPIPKIGRDRNNMPVFERGGQEEMVRGLSQKAIGYAATRKITEDTLKRARCGSTENSIIFPHFDDGGQVVMIKCWSCDGRKQIYTNDDPIPVLFGKHMVDPIRSHGALIICEGQWDALAWQQMGYPAVSIPSGAGNDDWIGEDWNFLNCFTDIYLDFDDDKPGREAEARVKIRLGYERCRSIHYRYKDANDALMAGDEALLIDAFNHARDAPIERIVHASSMREKVRQRLIGAGANFGTRFFLPQMNFCFRPHEITLWYGSTSHGKSSVLSNQICYSAAMGKKCMVASFEQCGEMTIAAMVKQFSGDPDIGKSDDYPLMYDELTSKVLFFDSMSRANPDEMIATIILAHKQLGVEEVVVDNVMTLEVDRQDNTAQAAVAEKFRVLVSKYPIHLHLVAHPRKPPSSDANKPPVISDIMGASEWSAMSHNVICVWRDVTKALKIEEMKDDNASPADIATFNESVPDGKLFVRKQRDSGELPMISFYYDKATKRAWKHQDDLAPYFFPEQPAEPEEEDAHPEGFD